MRNFQSVLRLCEDRIQNEKDNQKMMLAMDDMYQLKWEKPEQLKNLSWIRRSVSSDPHDAVRDAIRLFRGHWPKMDIKPLGLEDENIDNANDLEKAIEYTLKKSMTRRGNVLEEIIKNAFLYDRVAVQTIYLPHENKSRMPFGRNPIRKKAAGRHGKFAFVVHNSRDVFPIWSDYMLEGVFSKKQMRYQELKEFFGKKASKVSFPDDAEDYVTVFDYWDYEQRTVWVSPAGIADMTGGIELFTEKMDLPFLPWVVIDNGDILQPLLYSVYKAKQYDTQNIALTLLLSEIIAHAAAPRWKKSGINSEDIDIDYGDVNREVDVGADGDIEPLQPPRMDDNLLQIWNMWQGMISKSTLPRSIQSGDIPSGFAFASVQELVRLGVKSLTPGKNLVENVYGEVGMQVLEWINYTGDDLVSFVQNTPEGGTREVVVGAGTYDPDQLDFEVELQPNMDEDDVAKANAGRMYLEMGASEYKAKTVAGIDDPHEDTLRAQREAEEKVVFQNRLKVLSAQGDAQAMQVQALGQMAVQSMMQAAQQAQQQPRQSGQGFEAARGPGFNPAEGGQAALPANPEGQTQLQESRNR